MKSIVRLSLYTVALMVVFTVAAADLKRPNVILVMTDDQGWGQTGYYNHPVLKTPNLDQMAANGLRFDRFYAGAPVCSPTRATVLTGRACHRSGVLNHGYALRRQEKTIAQALKSAGYTTGHFGKWHLNALKGPGVPVFKDDPNGPGAFGFDIWLTVSNFFDIDPLMSLNGEFGQYKGTSSDIIVREALQFIKGAQSVGKPFLAVVWDGSPHSPFKAYEEDQKAFAELTQSNREHYGELAAFDRSLGELRAGLRTMGVAENTILWYCSDNGGLKVEPESVGGLRGLKGSIWEGGLRVPGVIEWPAVIKPRITSYPASTIDIFPTIADILGLPENVLINPVDGVSLKPIFAKDIGPRPNPIPFRFQGKGALVDNDFKLVAVNLEKGIFELYNLVEDKAESKDLAQLETERFAKMKAAYQEWNRSATASFEGKDYPEGKVFDDEAQPHFWFHDPRYLKHLGEWKDRWEYQSYIKRANDQNKKKSNNPQ